MIEKLDLHLSQQCFVEAKLRSVTLLLPRLSSLKSEAKHLSELVQFTSGLAESVSEKVKELDLTKVN